MGSDDSRSLRSLSRCSRGRVDRDGGDAGNCGGGSLRAAYHVAYAGVYHGVGPVLIRAGKSYALLIGVVLLLTVGLVLYSQVFAFVWDEGYHVLAAQLITRGKRPYLDFCFPQTPLNAYWNAALLRVFGDRWRVIHAGAALLTGGAIMLIADYVYFRFPVRQWRFAAALTAALPVAGSVLVVKFATAGQGYGLCLFMILAAFRLSISAVDSAAVLRAGLAGCFAAAAAASSLLTAPVWLVLALWLLLYNQAGSRWMKIAAFVAGSVIPFLPLLYLFSIGPRQVMFDIFNYQFQYRQVRWPGAMAHNIGVFASWIDSSQAFLLLLMSVTSLVFIAYQSGWSQRLRAEFYLCGCLALTLAIHISTALPAFERYYLLTVPFLGVLASAGLYSVSTRMYASERPVLSLAVFALLFSLSLAKRLIEDRDDFRWRDFERMAAKIDAVTPPDGMLLGDEHIYFLTRRPPPSGMELADSHKLEFPPATAALFHLLPQSELDRRIKAGTYDTVETCENDEEEVQALDLPRLYSQQMKVENSACAVFWNKKPVNAQTSFEPKRTTSSKRSYQRGLPRIGPFPSR